MSDARAPGKADEAPAYNARGSYGSSVRRGTLARRSTAALGESEEQATGIWRIFSRCLPRPRSQSSAGAADTVNMFADADALKDQAHKDLGHRDYDVSMLYKETGVVQAIAKSNAFTNVTLLVIMLNALWIGFESETNDADSLNDAALHIQVGEHFFATYFFLEWLTRFCAFRSKLEGFGDRWFAFDTFLVMLMVLETWVLPNAIPSAPPPDGVDGEEEETAASDLGQLGMLRLLRLLRLTRMVRLMRAVPELCTLLRSVAVALRSVLSTLALLLIFMYIFAIVFRSQIKPGDSPLLEERFGRLFSSMWTLLFAGTFLDNISRLANELLETNGLLTFAFVVFVMLSAYTVLNMLVGLLCEVVDAVAAAEKEKAVVGYVKSRLMDVLEQLDEDGNGTISRTEFNLLLEIPEANSALKELGVDVQNLFSLADHLFEADEVGDKAQDHGALARKTQEEKAERAANMEDGAQDEEEEPEDDQVALTFADFLETVIRLRATNHPSVLDIVDLRKLMLRTQRSVMRRLDTVEELNNRLGAEIKMINKTIKCLSSQDCKAALLQWCSRDRGADGVDAEQADVVVEDSASKVLDQKVYAEVDFDLLFDVAEEDEFREEWPEPPQEDEGGPDDPSFVPACALDNRGLTERLPRRPPQPLTS
eukprot:TRINITY_DN21381_c1_g3_i1.p1 TRINITY_DN21381_c1_g3~~TRINITY_DN21381_c1_g3_i1.p1  ORF type:complete len:652 (-),score=157.94 TRINITY_DN21381_c1_g3_i1:126-2081(-)